MRKDDQCIARRNLIERDIRENGLALTVRNRRHSLRESVED